MPIPCTIKSNNLHSFSEVVPTMPDLHSLTWNNSGKLEQLKVIEMCTSKHKCKDLSQILGQPESHLTPPVKRVPSSCCLAVFQRWLVCSSSRLQIYDHLQCSDNVCSYTTIRYHKP